MRPALEVISTGRVPRQGVNRGDQATTHLLKTGNCMETIVILRVGIGVFPNEHRFGNEVQPLRNY